VRQRRPNRVTGPGHDGFWEYCAAGELRIQRCDACGHRSWPPVESCERCDHRQLTWQLTSGLGRVVSWCTFERQYYPELDVPWDTILVGDMCYERPLAERLLGWLIVIARDGANVLLGDPGRSYFPKSGVTKLATYNVQTTRELEDREIRETSVYRLAPDILPGAGPT